MALPSRAIRTWMWRGSEVTPAPQVISTGLCSLGIPVLSTTRMPVKQARSGSRGQPYLGFAGAAGTSGVEIVRIRLKSASERAGCSYSFLMARGGRSDQEQNVFVPEPRDRVSPE